MNIEKRLKNIQNMLEDYFTDYKGDKEYVVACRKVENLYASEEDINCRNRIIKNWKAYSLQKVKSLALHMSKGNSDKVQSINNNLVERYKLVETYKKDVEYFKKFVRSLYFIKNNLIEGE